MSHQTPTLPLVAATTLLLLTVSQTSINQPAELQTLSANFQQSVASDMSSADWPQWGGPHRDHHSSQNNLLHKWPEAGPPMLWQFNNTGVGYSAFAVVEGLLYTQGAADGMNQLICLDVSTGKEVWRSPLGPAAETDVYRQGWGSGPRSTPAVTGERVIALDDLGRLGCFARTSGQRLWQVDLVEDFGGSVPGWGYSESPLIDGERVVVCPGNRSYMIVLDAATGQLMFASTGFDQPAHYVSVVKQVVDGLASYVTATSTGLVAFSATDGRLLWQIEGSGNATATIATPIVKDQYVYHSSAYSAGCVLAEVSRDGADLVARAVYANKVMQNHHGSVILIDGSLFGVRKNGGFVCQDFLSGEMLWNERIPGESSAAITSADNRLYVYGEYSGTCWLVEPSREGWKEHGKLQLPQQTEIDREKGKSWTHPVVADGKLFLRDQELIFAFDISE